MSWKILAGYTAYTPYQPEVSQGRLEALLNFQQVTIDLSGLAVASASLLDEATAAAEAMAKRISKRKNASTFFIADDVHPQTLDVARTRAGTFGFAIVIAAMRQREVVVSVAADFMALVVLEAPGKQGADIVFGSAQRFGVPMGYGGPHAAFFATRDEHKRAMPQATARYVWQCRHVSSISVGKKPTPVSVPRRCC